MRLERIVVGIDFSWSSISALQWVSRELAPDAEFVLVHALVVPEPPGLLREPGATDTLVDLATESARRRLRAAANTLAQTNAPCVVRRGAPEDVLTATARELDADLIVMGPHRPRHGLSARMDTTVERLVARSNVPVLMLPTLPLQRPTHVLVPTEDVTSAGPLDAWADTLATRLGARITRLTVISASVPSHLLGPLPAAGATRSPTSNADANAHDDWIGRLLDHAADDAGIAERESTFGEPGQEILAAAARYGSLIVMARQRAGNLRRAFLGSVTREVLRGAHSPVVVIPQPH